MTGLSSTPSTPSAPSAPTDPASPPTGPAPPPIGDANAERPRRRTPRFLRVVEYHIVLYRAVWKGTVVSTVVAPILYLVSMGLGVGRLVDDDPVATSAALDGRSYLAFVAPGLLAAGAMQLAVNQSMYPVLASVKWLRTAYGQVSTPLRPVDLMVGTHAWIALRLVLSSLVFVAIMAVFGVVSSPWIVAAPFVAAAGGLAFSGPLSAWAIGREGDQHFPLVIRFVILPLFFLSGVFFPVEQLPAVLEIAAVVTPLWHTVEVVRGLTDGSLSGSVAARHLAVLVAYFSVGLFVGRREYRKRLQP